MSSLKTPEKLILAAAALLFVVGSVLAVAQPGNLGDEDTAAAPTSTSTPAPATTTTLAPALTTTSTVAVTSTLPGAEPTTTIAGSGLGTPGAPSGGDDGTAKTGGESMLGLGLALGAIGFVLRRTAQTRLA